MIGAKPAHLLLLLFLPAKSASPHFHLCPVSHSRGASCSDLLLVGKERETFHLFTEQDVIVFYFSFSLMVTPKKPVWYLEERLDQQACPYLNRANP